MAPTAAARRGIDSGLTGLGRGGRGERRRRGVRASAGDLDQRHCCAGDRGGWRPHTPGRGKLVALAKKRRLRQRQPQVAHVAFEVDPAIGRDQPIPPDRPAVPAVQQSAQLTGTPQPQQAHRRPWHPVAACIPVTDGAQGNTQVGGTGLAAQQAAMTQLPEAVRRHVPDAAAAAGGRLGRGPCNLA